MDFRASLRSDAKPQREERWRTDFHRSYERPCSSKSLVDAHFLINQAIKQGGLQPTLDR
jgi:hypothetical protein